LLFLFEREAVAIEAERSEFSFFLIFLITFQLFLSSGMERTEQSPAAVKEDVGSELLRTLEGTYICSMDSNDVSYSLRDRQVLKLLGKENQSAMFNDTVFIKRLVRICYLDRANESITFI
jgi:hypothetical protein